MSLTAVPPASRPACLGPFQDAMVNKVVERIEKAFAEVSAAHNVDEAELRAWVAWTAARPTDAAGGTS